MKGLLIKDFCLLLSRKKAFLTIAACGVVMGLSTDMSFVSAWLMIIMGIFSISTIAYDEYDNCYPFLMSLPVTPKCYALEKYVFSLLCMGFSVLLTALIALIASLTGSYDGGIAEFVLNTLLILPAILIIIDLNIPISIRYGSERGRTVMLILYGIVFAGIFLLSRIASVDVDALIDDITRTAAKTDLRALTAGYIAAAGILTAVSVKLSVSFMQKKEF